MLTFLLLIGSNAFMTMAWYGHLKFKAVPLIAAIFISWLIALPEYMLQVPANRLGHADEAEMAAAADQPESGWRRWWRMEFSAPQLKILQEVITISVFILFNTLYLREKIRFTDWAGFGLILLAVVVMMYPRIVAQGAEQKQAAGAVSLLPEDVVMQPVDGNSKT